MNYELRMMTRAKRTCLPNRQACLPNRQACLPNRQACLPNRQACLPKAGDRHTVASGTLVINMSWQDCGSRDTIARQRGQSRKDFSHKLSIAYKEARESHYWLRLLKDSGYLDAATFKKKWNNAMK